MGKTKAIKKRLEKAEKRQQDIPPWDLFGRYYDELTKTEKKRYWWYIYHDSYDMKEAEAIELQYISGTLHFVCECHPGDYKLPDLFNSEDIKLPDFNLPDFFG